MQSNKSRRLLLIALSAIIVLIGSVWIVRATGMSPCGDRSTYAYYKCKYPGNYDKDLACHKEYEMYGEESSLIGGPCPGDPQ